MTLTFDLSTPKYMGFRQLVVEHLCVESGDLAAAVLKYRAEKKTDRQTPVITTPPRDCRRRGLLLARLHIV